MAERRPRPSKLAQTSRIPIGRVYRPLASLKNWLWPVGIVAYSALFYWLEIPTFSQAFGRPFRRWEFFTFAILLDQLAKQWCGQTGQIWVWDRLPILGAAILILLSAHGWGRLSLRLAKVNGSFTSREQFVIGLLVGLGLHSTAVFFVGLAGLLHSRWIIFIWLCLPMALGGIRFILRPKALRGVNVAPGFLEGLAKQIRTRWTIWQKASAMEIAVFVCMAILTGFLLLGAVLPPTDFDVREYHLQAPKEFYQRGRIEFLPHNVYANMPLGAEMHALLGMVLTGEIRNGALVGKLLIAVYAILGAWLVRQAARRVASDTAGLVAGACFLGVPWVIGVSANGLIDVAFSVAICGSFFVLWVGSFPPSESASCAGKSSLAPKKGLHPSRSTNQPTLLERGDTQGYTGSLFVAGFLAGTAASMKYTGLVYAVLPLALLATVIFTPVKKPGGNGLTSAGTALLVFLVGALLACGGWYLKNLALTGNPVYPLAYSLFDGRGWDAEKAFRWSRVHGPPGFSLGAFLSDSLRILLTSEWQSGLVVPFAAAGLFRTPHSRRLAPVAFVVLWLFTVWWFFTHRIDRFWLPILPFLCILSGIGFETLSIGRAKWVVRLALFAGLFWAFLVTVSGAVAYNRFFAPLRELWGSPERIGQEHLILNELFSKAPSGSRLLTVGEAAVFDLQMPVLYATCFNQQPWEEITRGKTAEEIRRTLQGLQVAYVYVNWLEIARYRSPGNYGFTDYVQPEQFRELVQAGVLVPVLMPPETPNQIFLVK